MKEFAANAECAEDLKATNNALKAEIDEALKAEGLEALVKDGFAVEGWKAKMVGGSYEVTDDKVLLQWISTTQLASARRRLPKKASLRIWGPGKKAPEE